MTTIDHHNELHVRNNTKTLEKEKAPAECPARAHSDMPAYGRSGWRLYTASESKRKLKSALVCQYESG
jgi:hypothetical protein